MINDLIKFASHLDSKGLHKEANYLDGLIKKEAQDISGVLIKLLMPMATPMVQVMVDECVKDITAQAMKECLDGMGNKASIFFSGGDLSPEQQECIANVAGSVVQEKMSDPAVVQRVVGAGLKKLPGMQSVPLKNKSEGFDFIKPDNIPSSARSVADLKW